MGDTNASQQQPNQQHANQVGWQQQYGYYNYGAVPGQPYNP